MGKFTKLKSLLVLLLLITGCSDNKYYSSGSGTAIGEKVSLKGAEASSITLKNGLRAVIISSPERQDAAISVAVNVGSFSDPKEHVGLAHFVEHLLFLGTTDYPQADGLMDFIGGKGGSINADTASSRTRYYLSVDTETFPDAVHRLSRFFVNPLFQETFTDKEKNAINNEFLMRFDGVAQYRTMGALYQTGTSSRNFSVGNIESLGNTTAADARAFFEKYYSADKMALVISGPQSLQELTSLVQTYFSDVPSRPGIALEEQPPKINPDQLNEIIKINNPKYESNLTFSIILPEDFQPLPDSFNSFISRLLGGEGNGSLLVALQEKGWAVPKAGAIYSYINGKAITFSVDLTPEGVAHHKDVILLTKSYMEFLRGQKFPDYVQAEAAGLDKAYALDRSYSTLRLDEVAGFSGALLTTPNWQDVFGRREATIFVEADYTNFLAKLNFDKIYGVLIDGTGTAAASFEALAKNATLSDPDKLDFIEVGGQKYLLDGYVKFAYEVEPLILAGQTAVTSSLFQLPVKNDFIPQDFTMFPATDVVPKVNTANTEVFLNSGAGVTQPKAYFHGLFFSPKMAKADKKQFIKLVTMKNWMLSSIKEEIYPLVEADFKLELTVSREYKALEINCTGWSGSFEKSVAAAISALEFSDDEVAFARFKQGTLNSLNQQNNDPQSLLGIQIPANYIGESPTIQEQIAITESLTLADLKATYQEVFGQFYFQGVVSGNVKSSFAETAANTIQNKWQPTAVSTEQIAQMKISDFTTITDQTVVEINVADNQNAFVFDFYNFGMDSRKEEVITKMIGNWISGDFFNELRTQQQIAYSLSADYSMQGQYYGLMLFVQSGTNSSEDVSARMDAFLHKWVAETLTAKTQADVDIFVKRTQEADEASKKAPVSINAAISKFLNLDPVYDDQAEAYKITIDEVIQLARQKLINSPNGLIIKVRSNKDAAPQAAPQIARLLGPR